MPATLLTQPDPYALTQGGRMTYEFSADGRTVLAGTPSQNWLYVLGAVPAGTRFTLRWPAVEIELIAADRPTLPNEFPSGNGSLDYARQLMAHLSRLYAFRRDFTFELKFGPDWDFGPAILMTAKTKGPAYELQGVSPTGLGLLSKAGSLPQKRDRYGLLVELWVSPLGGSADLSTYQLLASKPLEADASGFCSFDAGTLLHAHLSADLPALSGGAATLARRSTCDYYLSYAEAWGQPLQAGAVTDTDRRTALWGGADYLHRAAGGFSLAPYVNGVVAETDQALRPGGSATRYVLAEQPEYLTLLNARTDRADVSIEFYLTMQGGSGRSYRQSLGPWKAGQKLTVPVGPAQAGLLRQAGTEVLQEYTARLVLTSNPTGVILSATYRYILDYAPRPWARFFLYQNSLGCPDTVVTFGKGSPELQITAEQAERSLSSHYEVTDGQFVDYDVRLQQQIELATGWREAADLRRFLDFYRSADRLMWLPTAQGLTAVPVVLLSKSIRQAKDGENATAHLFRVAVAFSDSFSWSGDPLVSDPGPPTGFQPGGSVTIQQVSVQPIYDSSVPQAARDLTADLLKKLKVVSTQPDPRSLGLMDQLTAEGLFTSKTEQQKNQSTTDAQLLALRQLFASQARIRARAIPKPQ